MDIGRQDNMPRRGYTTEQIIGKLREAEVLISQGQRVGQVSRGLGISDHTCYRWRKEYGGLRTDQAQSWKPPRAGELPVREACGGPALG